MHANLAHFEFRAVFQVMSLCDRCGDFSHASLIRHTVRVTRWTNANRVAVLAYLIHVYH